MHLKKRSEKVDMFKMLSFYQNIIYSVSNIVVQMFYVSTLCMTVSDSNSKSRSTSSLRERLRDHKIFQKYNIIEVFLP